LSWDESLVINPQWRKNKRDVRQAVVQPVLAGVRFDRDLLKEAAFFSLSLCCRFKASVLKF
jgi:hypothetical protein